MTTVGSLCSGYGGLDLGLALGLGVELRHAWHVEYDKHPSAILAARFAGVPNYGDVKLTNWAEVEPVDWLTAGYPCQPFSHAGKRKGSDDPRHLWPGVARAIGILRPRGVLLENVRGHVSLGLADVLADLSALRYDARWGVVRAADAGAPHGRARVFIVATDACGQRHGRGEDAGGLGCLDGPDAGEARQRQRARPVAVDRGSAAPADAEDDRLSRGRRARDGRPGPADGDLAPTDPSGDRRGEGRPEPEGFERRPDAAVGGAAVHWGAYGPAIARWERATGRPAPRPTEPGRRGERLAPAFVEWMMGLPAGWVTDVPGLPRNAQLKALGNGVVPQQAALAVRLLTAQAAEAAA